MVGSSQVQMVNIFSFLLQAAVQFIRSAAKVTTVTFGVLRSTHQTLTTLGT